MGVLLFGFVRRMTEGEVAGGIKISQFYILILLQLIIKYYERLLTKLTSDLKHNAKNLYFIASM